jgi:hypothetical protein
MTTLRPRLVLWAGGYVDRCGFAKVGVCGASFDNLPKVELSPLVIRACWGFGSPGHLAKRKRGLTAIWNVYIVNT